MRIVKYLFYVDDSVFEQIPGEKKAERVKKTKSINQWLIGENLTFMHFEKHEQNKQKKVQAVVVAIV